MVVGYALPLLKTKLIPPNSTLAVRPERKKWFRAEAAEEKSPLRVCVAAGLSQMFQTPRFHEEIGTDGLSA